MFQLEAKLKRQNITVIGKGRPYRGVLQMLVINRLGLTYLDYQGRMSAKLNLDAIEEMANMIRVATFVQSAWRGRKVRREFMAALPLLQKQRHNADSRNGSSSHQSAHAL